ncbi:MAG: ABC transporter ATP-binding protein [Streptococcaceae bacterium]|jgi:osmoprotectant transport system ATP-binding protein|nr:ABC transporter ATP-binding protein [Streptococcaceae bacterium]MCL2681225.1 ABC transporter ATP-binding protein [Streptococcaceae bacterium]MCL2858142.1 ABC transporter ATP-binding protein [Streptococcaceae bacterium]
MTITFKNVSKKYQEKSVLSDVNLTIESREFFVLVGASGGGKTTLLKMINRLIEPSSGEILIDNEDIKNMNLRDLRWQIGYVLQQVALFPNMTVLENIGLIPAMKGWKKDKIKEKAIELLKLVNLDPDKYLEVLPAQLSGGEAQRIGILRAIASNPKIILMDEPFSALDPISRKQLQELIKKLQKELKITTVFVTHDMNEAMILADHIAIMKEGVLQQTGTPSDIFQNPANAFVADFFKDFQENLESYKVSDLEKFIADTQPEKSLSLPDLLKSLTAKEVKHD